jgi:hypothetical protein
LLLFLWQSGLQFAATRGTVVSPAKKHTSKKAKPSKELDHDTKKRLEALALAALTALGVGIGEGAVHAWTTHNSQRMEEKQRPREDRFRVQSVVPEANLPAGDEPKQRLRIRSFDEEGNESHSFTHAASLREIAWDAYRPITYQPKEGEETVSINYQLAPSAPAFRVEMSQADVARILAKYRSAKPDFRSVKHLEISPEPKTAKADVPEPNPEKSTEDLDKR